MELRAIVQRYAEAIEVSDTPHQVVIANPRTGEVYRGGFASLGEVRATEAIDAAWTKLYPGELSDHRVGVPYPHIGRAKADHVITSDGRAEPEWAIEFKRLQFTGNNGKRNDFTTGKMLSPYLKDRSLLHDALRLQASDFTRRVAILGYSFDYDSATLAEARRRHAGNGEHLEVIDEVAKVVRTNGGQLRVSPLVEFADAIMRLRGLVKGPRAEARFEAWEHPAGGPGWVFGWEVRRIGREPGFDVRNPW